MQDNGFPIIPIQPFSKVPGIFNSSGQWVGYTGWTKHCDRGTTKYEVDLWSRFPDYTGIGAACGYLIAPDIDIVQDHQLAHDVEQLAYKMLGDTPASRIGMWPKKLLVYRTETPFKGIKKHPIEILGHGQQFVVEGIHPETGQPYYWPGDSLLDMDFNELPVVTEEMCHAFAEAAYAMIPPELRSTSVLGEDIVGNSDHHQSAYYLRGTIEALEDAMRCIANPDLDYHSWVRIGMALKGGIGDKAEVLFARWSALSKKNVPETTAKFFAGVKPTKVGAGTVYHIARCKGWKCPPHLTMNGAVAWELNNHPAEALIHPRPLVEVEPAEETAEETGKETAADGLNGANGADHANGKDHTNGAGYSNGADHANGADYANGADHSATNGAEPPIGGDVTVPEAFYDLSGIIRDFVEYTLATAYRPQRVLAVGAAIAAIGVLAGRRYRSPSNLRTNVLVLGMAESGAGKEHARQCVTTAFQAAGLTHYIGGSRLASGSGLLAALSRHPSTIFQLDEFGAWLKKAINPRAPKYVSEIWDFLTELATSAGTVFLGAEYSDQKEHPRQDIIEPCCVIHATTVPEPFWQALNPSFLRDGSFARWLIFVSDDPLPEFITKPLDMKVVPAELIDGFKAVSGGAGSPGSGGNLAGLAIGTPQPYTVPCDAPGAAALDELAHATDEHQRAHLGTAQSALLARVWEHVARVAMIHAISLDPIQPVIGLASVQWAEEIVGYCIDTMIKESNRNVSDNDQEMQTKRVLRIIRQAGAKGISRRSLTRATWFLGNDRRRDEVLAELRNAERIIQSVAQTAGRPTTIFRAAPRPSAS